LSSDLTPLPVGMMGELHIGGVGLARGYLNKPELTAEKFIENPFQTEEEKKQNKDSRLYKTGDLVRWLPDGNLEYIGRNDSQIKIRGYRVELGEVENALSNYKGVKQSVVITRKHLNKEGGVLGNKYLIGYYVSSNKLREEKIINYLQMRLPEYMVPSVLVHLISLPLTLNGKLDRNALPDFKFESNSNSYVEPRNDVEVKICQILAEVLRLAEDRVGIRDDFFMLGGDSIVAIQVVSRLRQRVGLNISVKDIFSYKNVERLYDNVLNKANSNIKQGLRSEEGMLNGEVPLLPVQKWFFESNFTAANHWNQSFIVRAPNLDINKLCISISKLVKYHDSFRLRYKNIQDSIVLNGENVIIQYYNFNDKIEELKTLDIRTLTAKQGSKKFEIELQSILTNWQSDFNLEVGPIYSIGYIYGYADGSSRIYFALHHLIVDSVSWRILVEDLRDIYNQKELSSKGSSYKQWTKVVKEYAISNQSEIAYWTKTLVDNNLLNNFIIKENTSSYASLELSHKQTEQLLQESNKSYNTQVNDILLTALGYALYEVTNNKVHHILLEGHGREELDSSIDVTRTLGWFTTMYPVRLEVSRSMGDSLKNVKENLRQIPNKGIGYGALIGYKSSNLPKISFNYLGRFDKEDNTQFLYTDNSWDIVEEDSGVSVNFANKDRNIININGLVIGGRLKFNIASKLDKKNITKLTGSFKQRLEDIISYTVKQTRSYFTVSDVDNIINQEYLDKLQEVKEIEGVYFANSLQQGFIYHALNQDDISDVYNIQLILQYNTQLEVSILKEAWYYAQKRFGSLRLRLAWEEELVQIIDKEGSLDWRYIDLSFERCTIAQKLKIERIQEEDRLEPYKLEEGSLFRVYVIKKAEGLYVCIFSHHHAILDGWSNPILLGYVHDIYLKLQGKETVSLSIDYTYEDAQKYLQKHESDNKDYWDNYISQIEERSNFSGLLIANKDNIANPEEQTLIIKDNLYYSLKNLGQEVGVTLNAILQYVWHKASSIYGNTNQTIVGIIVSGRNLPINDIENSVGLYINTLPLIVNHRSKTTKSIIESIKDIQSDINEINSRSEISLAKLQKGGVRLFDSLFMYENYPNITKEEQHSRLKVDFKGGVEKQEYPLGVIAYEKDNQLIFKLKYTGELFSKYSIENLLLTINTILEQIVNNPNQQAQNLSYLDEEQYKKIIHTWNNTDKDYPSNKTIHKVFEEQVELTPDSIAVTYEGQYLTYRA
ncbi:MAG: condensation domain-containing protein, partial [Proteobacteria bacterium]|nr:condensation domain-containing protein [Pseudomonadota bacterium]